MGNSLKQRDIPPLVLLSLYFTVVLKLASKDCHNGVYIRYRTFRKLFNIRYLRTDTKVPMNLIRDLLYADYCNLVAHTEADMQVT